MRGARTGTPGKDQFVGRRLDRKSTRLNSSPCNLVCRLLLEKKKRNINKTRDGLIRVRNITALNDRFNTSITHAYSIVIASEHITLNATRGGFLTASNHYVHV